MSTPIDLSRVTFIVMREMRWPIMALLLVYSLSIFGMVFVPGIDDESGKPQHLSIFHAFYFMTYTATTTGFGEIPFEFSDAQRFFAIICLYASVITWIYAIGAIVRLLQNPFFIHAVAEWRFSRSVRGIQGPFFILCGFGDTGSVLARGLSDYGWPCVIVDDSEERIKALQLRNYKVPMPGLYADASVPKHLLEAGLQRPNCKAIVAITNNEEVNLKISTTARVLNPNIRIITMSKVEVYEDTLVTLGGEVHIVDPFKTFAKVLAAAMHNPGFYALNRWLVREKTASIDHYVNPPIGKWVICGYGRMGYEVNHVLSKYGITTEVIDPDKDKGKDLKNYIVGRTTSKTLVKANIEQAVGILAGTNDDGHNLGILLNARHFNPNLFTIVRQNRHLNEVAFAASNTDMIMQPTLVTARKILFLLIAPLLKPFFFHLLENKEGRKETMEHVIERLRNTVGNKTPHLITINFTHENSKAVFQWFDEGKDVFLGDLLKDPDNRNRLLELVVFVIKSGDEIVVLPEEGYKIKAGDQLLFCGTGRAQRLFNATINNEYKLFYVQNGVFMPRSWLAQWIIKKTNRLGV
ncbi:MAG: potassium transporter [Methylococcaceae bacterium]|nr:potassium transporter [Methylococcaceae bacterium]